MGLPTDHTNHIDETNPGSHVSHLKTSGNHIACRGAKGQGMVEFALAFPLLLMLMFGIIEFGRLLFYVSAVNSAAREAARYGATAEHYKDCAGIRAAARRIGSLAGIQDSNIFIFYDDGSGGIIGSCPTSNLKLGTRLIVEIDNVQYKPWLPVKGIQPIDLHATVRRTLLIGLEIR